MAVQLGQLIEPHTNYIPTTPPVVATPATVSPVVANNGLLLPGPFPPGYVPAVVYNPNPVVNQPVVSSPVVVAPIPTATTLPGASAITGLRWVTRQEAGVSGNETFTPYQISTRATLTPGGWFLPDGRRALIGTAYDDIAPPVVSPVVPPRPVQDIFDFDNPNSINYKLGPPQYVERDEFGNQIFTHVMDGPTRSPDGGFSGGYGLTPTKTPIGNADEITLPVAVNPGTLGGGLGGGGGGATDLEFVPAAAQPKTDLFPLIIGAGLLLLLV